MKLHLTTRGDFNHRFACYRGAIRFLRVLVRSIYHTSFESGIFPESDGVEFYFWEFIERAVEKSG